MHEDFTSYNCIALIITVYPHNINIKLQKVKNSKICFNFNSSTGLIDIRVSYLRSPSIKNYKM